MRRLPGRITRERHAPGSERPWNVTVLRALNPDGSVLWPEHTELDHYRSLYHGGAAYFMAIFMQDPSGLSGAVFKPEWIKLYADPDWVSKDGLSAQEALREGVIQAIRPDPRGCVKAQAHDLAISRKEAADYYTRVQMLGTPDGSVLVHDAFRDRLTFKQMVRDMQEYGDAFRADAIGIETVQFQAAAFQTAIEGSLLPFVEVSPGQKDKVVRARSLAAIAEAGKFYVRIDMPRRIEYTMELVSFPGVHDDWVDASAYAYELCRGFRPGETDDLRELLEETRSKQRYAQLAGRPM